MSDLGGRTAAVLVASVVLLSALLGVAAGADGATLPAGFQDETVLAGLDQPTNFKFAPDGRVFVAQKSGRILVYDGLADETPELFANLTKQVYDYEDHGLLGLALDPRFDRGRPYVYVLYSYNHELSKGPNEDFPAWPAAGPGFENDECPESPTHGCVVSGRLMRLKAEGNHAIPSAAAPSEESLLEGWCQQSTTHSIGDIEFGPEGALFVSGGEGAMYQSPDYGEFGNLCGDPPGSVGTALTRPSAEGGSLRAQSLLRPSGPTLLSGALLRVKPGNGDAWPGNPLASSSEANARKIVGFGFRNPFRFAINPRTANVFVNNVGANHYEEIDRVPFTGASPYNSGWPCYEGPVRNAEYTEGGPLNVCSGLYGQEDGGHPQTSPPLFSYKHKETIIAGESCASGGGTAISGSAFYEGSQYPAEYKNALFFADFARGCIYAMKASAFNGEPDPAAVSVFLSNTVPLPGIDIEQGPEGDLFYAALGGTIHRISYPAGKLKTPPSPPPTQSSPPSPKASTHQPPTILRHPARKTTSRRARFVFSAEAGLGFRCKLDGGEFTSCRSPRVYRHLRPGPHAFRVVPVDSSGEQVAGAATFAWRVRGAPR